jgi:DNA-binding transcriptional ArsR family regulator
MIDQLRSQIQERLEQLLAEAEKLRRALAALGGGDGSRSDQAAARRRRSAAKGQGRPQAPSMRSAGTGEAPSTTAGTEGSRAGASSASAKERATSSSAVRRSRTRAPLGATKSAVLAALSDGHAMTAGEVAAATGLGPATVSTTLSKLAKTGELAKADRGYRRPGSRTAD